MKKITFIILTLLLSISSYSQFGLKAGADYGTVAGRDGTSYKWGFHGGMTYDFKVGDMFYIQPAAMLSLHSFELDERDFVRHGKVEKLSVEVPIVVSFRPVIDSHGTKLVIDLGPYIKYGIAGDKNVQLKDIIFSGTGEAVISGSAYDDAYAKGNFQHEYNDDKMSFEFNRLDVGLNVGFGIEVQSIYAGVSYQYGFTTAEKNNSDAHNSIFRFSLGYRF